MEETIGTIAPEIYSHFVENLGGVVYDGIWVGERSPVAHVNGIRKQLVDSLRRVKTGVIRWPGGCFADQYDWRDGTGPRDKRPRRTNFWVDAAEWPKDAKANGPQRYDPNEFGTVEFARFCRLAGAQPYFAANLRSLPTQELWRWVEYCDSPAHSTTLGDPRASDGEAGPLDVRFWGVGNESWGCGAISTRKTTPSSSPATPPGFLRMECASRSWRPGPPATAWIGRGASAPRRRRTVFWAAPGGWRCIIMPGTPAADAPATGAPARATL